MKVEIELSEIEHLRDEARRANKLVQELEEKLKANSEKEWEKKAIRLSKRMAGKYIEAIFEKLGFDKNTDSFYNDGPIQWGQYLDDKKWYEDKDKLDIQIAAQIYNQFKIAYLTIGVIPDREESRRYAEKTLLSEEKVEQ